jgi:hypothetical protein
MKVGDVVRFMEPAQRTEGEVGIVIDDSPDLVVGSPGRYVEIFWPNGSRIFESKMFLEVVDESNS